MRQYPSSRPQIPPLVPTSTNSIPRFLSASARRSESRKFELPPSMTMSPLARCGTSCSMVLSTGAPAGTITQTTRRGASCFATSARSLAPFDPLATCAFTASALESYTISSCPPWSNRCTMLPPIRPNPIIASCIAAPPSDGHGQRREIPAQLWGVVIQNRVHPEPPCGLEVVFAIVDECCRRRLGLRHHQGTLVDLPRGLEDAHPARCEERVEDVPQAEHV